MKAKQFFYISLSVLAILVVGGGYSYYRASQSLHNQTVKLSQQMAVDTVADERIIQLIALRKQYERFMPLIPNINNALPAAKQQSQISLQLQELASEAGMNLPSVTFASSNGLPTPTSQTISSGGVLALPVTFELTGSYSQLQQFLVSLENLDRYTAVTTLQITRADAKAKTLNFSLNINVYVKP